MLRAHDVEIHARVLLLVKGKDRRQDVKAGGFTRAHRYFAASRAVKLIHGHDNMTLTLQAVLGKRLKQPSRRGKRHLAAIAVEEPRAHFFLKGANLRGDGRLRHAQLLGCAREAAQPANLLKCPELLEIHAEYP